jgi:hypothetical protein
VVSSLKGMPRGRGIQLLGFPKGQAPFPVYPSIGKGTVSYNPVQTTSHTVNLPAYCRYGDIVVGTFQADAAATPITLPDASYVTMNTYSTLGVFFYRICDGSELDRAESFVVTTTNSVRSVAMVWRVRDAEYAAPQFSTLNNNTSTPMSPPTLTFSTGLKRAALFLFLGRASTALPESSVPGFTDIDSASLLGDTGEQTKVQVYCGYAQVFGTSLDPAGQSGNASNFGVMSLAFLAPVARAGSGPRR